MNFKRIGLWVGLGSVLILGLICLFSYFNTQAKWAQLDNACTAVFDRQRVSHDEMWKTISAQYGLKDELKETTMAMIDSYVARGESYKGTQWMWIQENYPQINQTGSADFYRQLANTISDQNGKLTSIRNDVITVTNEFNNYVTNPWNQFFLFGEQENKKVSRVITSSVTEKAAETLKDDQEWLNNRK